MDRSSNRLNVALLAGGDSAERSISLTSGREVAAALEEAGHRVVRFDPAETRLSDIDWTAADVCFLALHGGAGEDGRVQLRLEQLGVPYTGSGPDASRWAMRKSVAKERFVRQGIATPDYLVLTIDTSEQVDDIVRRHTADIERLGWPIVVKPDTEGSSFGLALAESARELPEYVSQARSFGPTMILERYVPGREITVAVLGRRPLPLVEVVSRGPLFDFQSKYEADGAEFHLDLDLSPIKTEEIQTAAVRAAEALGTAGLVRVDTILDPDGRVWVLEVNTLPGMTPQSLAPKAASRVGMNLAALCDWMLRDAMRRSIVPNGSEPSGEG